MKLYRNIDTLPIFLYNRIRHTSDFRYLIKGIDIDNPKGKETDELKEVFKDIQDQYAYELEKTRPRNKDNDIIKQIMRLECDKNIIVNSLIILRMSPDKDSFAELLKLGYVADFNKKDDKKRIEWVNEIFRRSKVIDGKIDMLKFELSNDEENSKPVEFEDILLIAEDHLKRNIDPMKTSVKSWIHIENRLLKASYNGKDKE